MEILSIILILFGLSLFEIITSIDNAIINAEILSKMSEKARKWFLLWGILFAVFVLRGLLPLIILWVGAPELGFVGAFKASFSSDPHVVEIIEGFKPVLLIAGGAFLILLFLHWIFMEPKHYGLRRIEDFIDNYEVWFFAFASVFLMGIVYASLIYMPWMAFGAVVGSTAFFITHGFKDNAEKQEGAMVEGKTSLSDTAMILYLIMIDAIFSIDGVLGAFSFTVSIPLILIGNGIGAIFVRQITVGNIERIKKYKYLKNGAMYSILALGIIMILDSFGVHIPEWVGPITTFLVVGYFFYKSYKEVKNGNVS